MRTIAHLSDLHFDRVDHAAERALIAQIAERQPSVIVVTGDLTQRARRGQFEHARIFLEHLPSPQVILAGNHDIPLFDLVQRFRDPLKHFRELISPELDPVFEDDELCIVGLNSPRPTTWQSGRLSSAQWDRAFERFRGNAGRCHILATHHPLPPSPTRESARAHLLTDPADLKRLATSGCDLWLSGHFHHAYSTLSLPQRRFLDCPVPCLQAGTAISRRTRKQPNSYNWITIDEAVIHWEVSLWNGRKFLPEDMVHFPRKNPTLSAARNGSG